MFNLVPSTTYQEGRRFLSISISCQCHFTKVVFEHFVLITKLSGFCRSCKENPNKSFANCSIPQVKSNEEINKDLGISESSSCDEEDDAEATCDSKPTYSGRPGMAIISAILLLLNCALLCSILLYGLHCATVQFSLSNL